jgi:DNA-binding CsgD family transcriptional regulator
MRELRSSDLRKLLDAALMLHEDLDPATLPTRVVAAVSSVVSSDFTCYADIDPVAGTVDHRPEPNDPRLLPGSPEWAAYLRHQPEHPVIAYFHRTPDAAPIPLRISDFLSDRQFRSLGLYSEFFRVVGTDYQLSVPIGRSDARMVGVSLSRGCSDYSERERDCLALLRAHIVQAFRNARRFERLLKLSNGDAADGDNRTADHGPDRIRSNAPLTKREAEILYWAAAGKTNDEIAQIVGATTGTVKKHLQHVYDKLGVPNRAAAVRHMNRAAVVTK